MSTNLNFPTLHNLLEYFHGLGSSISRKAWKIFKSFHRSGRNNYFYSIFSPNKSKHDYEGMAQVL